MAVAAGSFLYKSADAQVGLNVNLHLGGISAHVVLAKPAPVMVAYPQDDYSDDYYYLPEVEAYYSVPQHCYFYMDGNRWVSAAYLPGAYRNYNWQSLRHYEVRERHPYMHHNDFVNRFGGRRPGDDRGYANRYDQHGYDNRGFNENRGWNDQRGNERRDNRDWGGQRDRGRYDNQNYGQQSYPQNGYNRGGQDRGGYGQQPQQDRGQYQNNNPQPANNGQYQNSNQQQQQQGGYGQHTGGQNNGQWQRGGDQQRGGQNSQPSNNQGQNDHYTSRGARNNDGDQRLAQNRTGDMRPSRF